MIRRLVCASLGLALAGSAWAVKPPKWISGADPAYPETAFVIGVGVGNDLDDARANARAEISRTFQARVQQTMTDTQTESSESLGSRHGPAAGTQKSEMTTKVATETLLEGAQIKETWFDKKKKKHYALAALDKRAARQALSAQITEKEETINTRLNQAEDADAPLSKARALAQALNAARERDVLVARRRLVDMAAIPDLPGETSTAQNDRKLGAALSKIQFRLDAETGPKSRLKQAVAARISELGFKLTDDAKTPLVLKCALDVQPFDRGHPQWKFYHWEATVELTEDGKTAASATPSGEEGHLIESTAQTKAREAGEQGVALEAQKLISQYVFGE
jgi:hypothetical protein